MADQKVIPASAWDSLQVKSFRKGILVERTKARTEIFDVRVFPAIEAPDAIQRLDGRTMIEAFERFVFSDPQRIALRARAAAAGGRTLAVTFERNLLKAVWPVDFGTASVWGTPIAIPRYHHDPAVDKLCRIADRVLRKRFGRLIGYLSSGELAAQGLSREGVLTTVPRSLWQRDRTYLDLYSGDLLEDAPDDREHTPSLYRTILLGLTFLRAEKVDLALHVKPIALDERPPSAIKSPSGESDQTSASLAESRTSAETSCAEWLIAIINGSPKVRLFTSSELWQQTRIKWPTLSERGYQTARKIALATTENVIWSRGGAPRKSGTRNIES